MERSRQLGRFTAVLLVAALASFPAATAAAAESSPTGLGGWVYEGDVDFVLGTDDTTFSSHSFADPYRPDMAARLLRSPFYYAPLPPSDVDVPDVDVPADRDLLLDARTWEVAAPALASGWPRYSFPLQIGSGSVPRVTDLDVPAAPPAPAAAPAPAPAPEAPVAAVTRPRSLATGGTIEPTTGWVSSQIGNRCYAPDFDHYGIDIAAEPWTSVLNVYDGVVDAIVPEEVGGAAGNHVVISHRNGWVSKYFHLVDFQGGLRVGQALAKGRGVGFVGNTGAGTGPHLHFEMRQFGRVARAPEMNAHYACGRWVDRGQPSPVHYDGLR